MEDRQTERPFKCAAVLKRHRLTHSDSGSTSRQRIASHLEHDVARRAGGAAAPTCARRGSPAISGRGELAFKPLFAHASSPALPRSRAAVPLADLPLSRCAGTPRRDWR